MNSSTINDRDPVIVLAADENFAMPLAVTVRSLLDHLAPDRMAHLRVLDGGISDQSKDRLLQSWPSGRYEVQWLRPDASELAALKTSHHVNHIAYYRILIPHLLNETQRKAIYLDSDLLVLADVGKLWDVQTDGHWCLAAQDFAAPVLDASKALSNYGRCGPYLAAARPVPNYDTLGLTPDAKYFNSGVLVLDLPAWRQQDLSSRLVQCLHDNREHVLWWDQYALNVVLAGHWGQLDPRWNQGSHIFEFPTAKYSPLDQMSYDSLKREPFIVHFTSPVKPWHALCPHPYRNEFFKYLDLTSWSGWRPPRSQLIQASRARAWRWFRRRCGILARRILIRTRGLTAGRAARQQIESERLHDH